jgi:ribosomal protein L40E
MRTNCTNFMGERACYLEFCSECDARVTIADDKCLDCGAILG